MRMRPLYNALAIAAGFALVGAIVAPQTTVFSAEKSSPSGPGSCSEEQMTKILRQDINTVIDELEKGPKQKDFRSDVLVASRQSAREANIRMLIMHDLTLTSLLPTASRKMKDRASDNSLADMAELDLSSIASLLMNRPLSAPPSSGEFCQFIQNGGLRGKASGVAYL